jgi:hypothetical protein
LKEENARGRWKFGIAAGIFLLIFGLYPQLRLWHARGSDWAGAYAYNDLDEMAYGAYLQALIDGRPRRNDPYTGRDHSLETPQPESLFSIQFLTPYAIAIPARIFGASASTAMIFVAAIAAFSAALALFWLIVALTRNSLFAFAATLFVLCGGALAIGEGGIIALTTNHTAYPYFPFLRRYIPALPFPVFFVFCAAVWKMLTGERRRFAWCGLAALSFAFLVYSYFYLWTTAAAWSACLALVWLAFVKENRGRNFKLFATLGGLMLVTLIPYFLLLQNRSTTTDSVQLLVETRMPDLLRAPELWSLAALTAICFGVWRKRIDFAHPASIFAVSLALVSFAVFNQQILTGRSLQPIHYGVFIANYISLAAFALSIFFLWRGRFEKSLNLKARSLLFAIAFVSLVWGAAESYYTIHDLDEVNIVRDEAKLVGNRLTELAQTDLFDENGNRHLTINFNLLQGDDQPTVAPQAVLWARHLHVFAGADWEESKRRFFHFLYFANVDEINLETQIRQGNVVSIIALFGWGRHTARLTSDFKPLTNSEIAREIRAFAEFRRTFGAETAAQFPLKYVVADDYDETDFSLLDRWYERDAGETVGKFKLYRVRLRGGQ